MRMLVVKPRDGLESRDFGIDVDSPGVFHLDAKVEQFIGFPFLLERILELARNSFGDTTYRPCAVGLLGVTAKLLEASDARKHESTTACGIASATPRVVYVRGHVPFERCNARDVRRTHSDKLSEVVQVPLLAKPSEDYRAEWLVEFEV